MTSRYCQEDCNYGVSIFWSAMTTCPTQPIPTPDQSNPTQPKPIQNKHNFVVDRRNGNQINKPVRKPPGCYLQTGLIPLANTTRTMDSPLHLRFSFLKQFQQYGTLTHRRFLLVNECNMTSKGDILPVRLLLYEGKRTHSRTSK